MAATAGRGKAANIVYWREDGLWDTGTTLVHVHVPGHVVRVEAIPDGWVAACLRCRAYVTGDTEGEARRWAELHLGQYRPMRPN